MNETQKAVVTVVGNDHTGIIARITGVASECNANVTDLSQSILDGIFFMALIIDITAANCPIDEIEQKMLDAAPGLEVHVMHEKIFDSMHRI